MICRWRLTGESSIRRCSIDKLVNKPFDPVSDIISYYTALNHLIFRIERHHLSRWGERSDQCHPRLKLFETSLSSKKQYPILRFLELLLICVSRRTNDESTWLLRSMLSWGVLLTYSIFTNAGIFPRDPTLLKYVFNGKEDQKQTFTSRHSSLLPTSSHPLNVVNIFFDHHLTYEDSFLVHWVELVMIFVGMSLRLRVNTLKDTLSVTQRRSICLQLYSAYLWYGSASIARELLLNLIGESNQ